MQMFQSLYTMHKHFIIKPNPYVSKEEAESAITKLVLSQTALIISCVSLSLSLFKIFPKFTLNSAYKKFNVIQFVGATCLFGMYIYDISKLRKFIPDEEFEKRTQGSDKVIY